MKPSDRRAATSSAVSAQAATLQHLVALANQRPALLAPRYA
jgi:hypothetical protein